MARDQSSVDGRVFMENGDRAVLPASGIRRAAQILSRAARRQCPNCGHPGIFKSWFRMVPRCPSCGLPMDRGEHGYVVGAYMFNVAVSELVFAAVLVTVLVLTWPTPPWNLLMYGGAALMILLPIVFYPFARMLFLGIDLIFNPSDRRPGD